MVQIYKPTLDVLKQQAELARKQEEARKSRRGSGSGDFTWGELKEGDNILRVLPPTNSRGELGKRVETHYFFHTPLEKLVDPMRCLVTTHPDVPGVRCAIDAVGDKIKAQFPQLDITRWHRPGAYVYIQAVDRADPVPVAKIYKLAPAVYNWLQIQQETLMMQGVDLTDLFQGVDIKITRTVSQTKGKNGKPREQTKYEKTLWSFTGLTPVAPTQDLVNAVVNSMKDLDAVFKYPTDEKLVEFDKGAADIYSFYVKQSFEGNRTQVAGTFQRATPPDAGQFAPNYGLGQAIQPTPAAVQQVIPAVAQAIGMIPGATFQGTAGAPIVAPAAIQGFVGAQMQYPSAIAAQPMQLQAAPVQQFAQTPSVPQVAQTQPWMQQAQQVSAQPMQFQAPAQAQVQQVPAQAAPVIPAASPQQGAPTDRPACFGGAQPRTAHHLYGKVQDSGGTGYSTESELCLTCKYEFACLDLCKERGIHG